MSPQLKLAADRVGDYRFSRPARNGRILRRRSAVHEWPHGIFERCHTPMGQLVLEHVHGVAARIGAGDTAFPHCADGHNFLVLSQWTDATNTEACIAWARERRMIRCSPSSPPAGT